ncbi:hypothetical protein [Streptomyces sp. NPDC088801]|uniref:hypothetical protein n=1 Tax=Streptomyces sp. NPDC088801 TaxID=3365903 RepID=UPI00382442B5
MRHRPRVGLQRRHLGRERPPVDLLGVPRQPVGDTGGQSRDALADYIEAAERVGGENYPPLGLTLSS